MQDCDALRALRRLAARIGQDRTLVQGAGGNVSLKLGDLMWVKASGTWLADADAADIFVPVALPSSAKSEFAVSGPNPSRLRPSIETSLHAALPQAVVLHIHSVDVIAWAVRADARGSLAERLADLPWAYVPYRQPGPKLTAALRHAMRPGVNVFVLANHGLVVAAEGIATAEALLRSVMHQLAIEPRATPSLTALPSAGHGFHPVADPVTHSLATDPASFRVATAGALYPDHVVFLGAEPVVIEHDAELGAALARHAAAGRQPPRWVIVNGAGVLVADDIARGGDEMLRCLADVAARIPAGAQLAPLTTEDIAVLMNWDAEHYRQRLAMRACA
ncbi:class II aldolase/adducin family protein [Sphingomonas sp.]|uniref:class II aldolase/adducin family protein n=1 Tax=Sphingomonas sp. TaxID=28214 RepID=UPI001EB80E3F|nr:class II aldolase/adducin family protein [Sphingomonas sp.]MBX3593557.1 class II aldolase [Sphingomonas sp.]